MGRKPRWAAHDDGGPETDNLRARRAARDRPDESCRSVEIRPEIERPLFQAVT
jgi:hypothetical protein